MKKLFFLFLLPLFVFANQFTVASYNIENLFDLNFNKSDYKEYKPNTNTNWNKRTFEIKLKNSVKVLKDLNANIVALQEIENKDILKLLQKKLPQYKYISFSKYANSSVGVGFLSKIKIIDDRNINVRFTNKIFRPILETTFEIDSIKFKIFNNHWPSKRVSESYRIKYAKYLFDRISKLPKDYDYILLGDFNSNYNEFETIHHEKKLNNSSNITGINHVLNTYEDKNFVNKKDLLNSNKVLHFNLWLELPLYERFSSKFRGKNVTPDNILIPTSMLDNKKISYIQNSFKVFKPSYLYKNGKVKRWRMKNRIHLGQGYSDHLPVIASFSTKKQEKLIKEKKLKLNTISSLYEVEKLEEEVLLKDCIVILKHKDLAIIKQKNNRAVLVYKNVDNLSLGFAYDIYVEEIKTYKGLKEIIDFNIDKYKGKIKNYKTLYKDFSKTKLFHIKNQNEVIENIIGVYKKGYLYYDDKKISIYFKDKNHIVKNNSKVKIKKAQLGYFLNKIQLVVFNKSDINYVD